MTWLPLTSRLLVYSYADQRTQVANLQALDGQIVVLAQQHDVTELLLQLIEHRVAFEVVDLEQRNSDALRRELPRPVRDLRRSGRLRVEPMWMARERQHRGRPVTQMRRLLDTSNGADAARSPLPITTTGSLHQPHLLAMVDDGGAADRNKDETERQGQREGDAGVQRWQLEREGKGREDQKTERGDVGEAAKRFDRTESESGIQAGERIAENKQRHEWRQVRGYSAGCCSRTGKAQSR